MAKNSRNQRHPTILDLLTGKTQRNKMTAAVERFVERKNIFDSCKVWPNCTRNHVITYTKYTICILIYHIISRVICNKYAQVIFQADKIPRARRAYLLLNI